MRQQRRQTRRQRQRCCTGFAVCNCSAILYNWQTFSATACKRQFFCATLPGENGFLGVSRTNACIYDLREFVDIDSWRKTAPFPYESMQTTPDTFFDKNKTPGSAPSYQWYPKIEVACQNFRLALVDWRKCEEEFVWRFRKNLVEDEVPSQITRLNRMHCRDLRDRRSDPCRRRNRPVLQIPTFLGCTEDASIGSISYVDSWAHFGPHEILSN